MILDVAATAAVLIVVVVTCDWQGNTARDLALMADHPDLADYLHSELFVVTAQTYRMGQTMALFYICLNFVIY